MVFRSCNQCGGSHESSQNCPEGPKSYKCFRCGREVWGTESFVKCNNCESSTDNSHKTYNNTKCPKCKSTCDLRERNELSFYVCSNDYCKFRFY